MSDVVIALQELKASLGKIPPSSEKRLADVWTVRQWHQHPTQVCYLCNQRPGNANQCGCQWAVFNQMGNWTCGKCVSSVVTKLFKKQSRTGRCMTCSTNTNYRHNRHNYWMCESCLGLKNDSDELHKKIDAKIKSERKKVTDMAKKNKTVEEAAIPYINSGLAEPFAIAIARDVSLIDQILDLWEQDWWKQYPPEDILVCAVLDGELSEDDGRWLNDIRSDHERLALSCVKKEIDLDWARALLDAGFLKHPEAVPDVLDGGHPVAIARIRRIKVDAELLPPQLGFKVTGSKKKANKIGTQTLKNATPLEIMSILNKLSPTQISEITNTYVAKNAGLNQHKGWIDTAWSKINQRSFGTKDSLASLRTIANEIELPRRTQMNKNEFLAELRSVKANLRRRIGVQMEKNGLKISDYVAN